jgi:hypothetical protein
MTGDFPDNYSLVRIRGCVSRLSVEWPEYQSTLQNSRGKPNTARCTRNANPPRRRRLSVPSTLATNFMDPVSLIFCLAAVSMVIAILATILLAKKSSRRSGSSRGEDGIWPWLFGGSDTSSSSGQDTTHSSHQHPSHHGHSSGSHHGGVGGGGHHGGGFDGGGHGGGGHH